MSETTRVTCQIKELKDYQFVSLQMEEHVGDSLPTGLLTFLQDVDNEDLSIDSLTLDLLIDDYQLSAKAFVESVENYRGENKWQLTFVPKDFYQTPRIQEFSGIKSLVQKLTPYDVLSSIDSDTQLDNQKLYQNYITDYQCLIKYLRSLRVDLVHSFRFDGLQLTDVTKRPTEKINTQSVERHIPLNVRRNKFTELEATSASLDDNGLDNVHYNNETIAISQEFTKAYMNSLENFKLYKCLGDYISHEFPDYMNLRSGDLVKLTNSEYEENNYIVIDNFLELSPGRAINRLNFSAI